MSLTPDDGYGNKQKYLFVLVDLDIAWRVYVQP